MYFTNKEAAEYCRCSYETWKRWKELYSIPTSGPYGRRYNKDVLDDFMASPSRFLKKTPSSWEGKNVEIVFDKAGNPVLAPARGNEKRQ